MITGTDIVLGLIYGPFALFGLFALFGALMTSTEDDRDLISKLTNPEGPGTKLFKRGLAVLAFVIAPLLLIMNAHPMNHLGFFIGGAISCGGLLIWLRTGKKP